MAKRLRKTVPKERLSPSEWEIMQICWRLGRCTVREVLAEDLKTHKRDYRTILTFMTRMARKGWLRVEKSGTRNVYRASVPERLAVQIEISRFLDSIVGTNREHLELLLRETKLRRRLLKAPRLAKP